MAGMYNASEFLTMLKDDIGLDDIPLPVTDKQLLERIQNSSLKMFSQMAPVLKTIAIGPDDIVEKYPTERKDEVKHITYEIPEHKYYGSTIIGVCRIDPMTTLTNSDYYVPYDMDVATQIAAVAETKLAATSAYSNSKAPTRHFVKPNRIEMFNCWYSAYYEVDLLLTHDISLATIPDDSFDSFRELAMYDLQWYLYNKLKRKNNIDTGVGSVDLKIDDWADARDKFYELINRWKEEGASLDYASINFF